MDINQIAEYARKYKEDSQESIKRNSHMNRIPKGESVEQKHIDAVLVDFINYIGMKYGIDYGMYTIDLQ